MKRPVRILLTAVAVIAVIVCVFCILFIIQYARAVCPGQVCQR